VFFRILPDGRSHAELTLGVRWLLFKYLLALLHHGNIIFKLELAVSDVGSAGKLESLPIL